MGWNLSGSDFNDLIAKLKADYTVLAPKRFIGRGRFSETDLIRYDEIETLDDIVWDEKSTFSPKEVVFPITQTLFHFTEKAFSEPEPDEKNFLIFLRPCDINGIRRLDTIYLKNGSQSDAYYARLRQRVRFVMIECTEGFDTCFCVSMKSNVTADYDMAVRLRRGGALLEVKNDAFMKYVPPGIPQVDFTPAFIQENKIQVTVPDVDEMPVGIYTHEMWNEYKSRCIACGRCNTTSVLPAVAIRHPTFIMTTTSLSGKGGGHGPAVTLTVLRTWPAALRSERITALGCVLRYCIRCMITKNASVSICASDAAVVTTTVPNTFLIRAASINSPGP